MIEFIKGGFIITGSLFILLAAVGILRLPDLLTRMHATTKAAALGVMLIMLAAALHFAETGVVENSSIATTRSGRLGPRTTRTKASTSARLIITWPIR